MTTTIDTGLDFFRQVLALRAYRQQLLTADIANASTPGFKAVDLDFNAALATALQDTGAAPGAGAPPLLWQVDDARHLQPASLSTPAASAVKYQANNQVTLDGNSVDLDQEKVTAAANAVDYAAAATFTSQTIKMLMTAINGSAAQGSGGA